MFIAVIFQSHLVYLQGSISSSGPTTPTPQTPVTGPVTSSAPVQETDLPAEMLTAGWRKFWSKREQRVYFWNRVSGESLWDMPGAHSAHTSHPPGVSSLDVTTTIWSTLNSLHHFLYGKNTLHNFNKHSFNTVSFFIRTHEVLHTQEISGRYSMYCI